MICPLTVPLFGLAGSNRVQNKNYVKFFTKNSQCLVYSTKKYKVFNLDLWFLLAVIFSYYWVEHLNFWFMSTQSYCRSFQHASMQILMFLVLGSNFAFSLGIPTDSHTHAILSSKGKHWSYIILCNQVLTLYILSSEIINIPHK